MHNTEPHSSVQPPVPRETEERLTLYLGALLQWNKKINLIGDTTLTNSRDRHLADSLQLLAYLEQGNKSLIDIGSGGGLPAVPIAIARPDITVYSLESDQRKVAFLTYIKSTLNLGNFHPIAQRIELWHHEPVDYLTARACASLEKLIDYAHPFMHTSSRCLFLKGRQYQKEVEAASASWEWNLSIHSSQVNDAGVILDIGMLSRRTTLMPAGVSP